MQTGKLRWQTAGQERITLLTMHCTDNGAVGLTEGLMRKTNALKFCASNKYDLMPKQHVSCSKNTAFGYKCECYFATSQWQ